MQQDRNDALHKDRKMFLAIRFGALAPFGCTEKSRACPDINTQTEHTHALLSREKTWATHMLFGLKGPTSRWEGVCLEKRTRVTYLEEACLRNPFALVWLELSDSRQDIETGWFALTHAATFYSVCIAHTQVVLSMRRMAAQGPEEYVQELHSYTWVCIHRYAAGAKDKLGTIYRVLRKCFFWIEFSWNREIRRKQRNYKSQPNIWKFIIQLSINYSFLKN